MSLRIDCREVGSSCTSERRAIEMIDHGAAATSFMRFGDTVSMAGVMADRSQPFGIIHQSVIQASQAGKY
ncbi:MAG: hypothetical protein ABI673_07250 [Novosphingobium sp.]